MIYGGDRMTNADKFLKDGVSIQEFINALRQNALAKEYQKYDSNILVIVNNFLHSSLKPKVSSDELVILRNIGDGFKIIGKTGLGILYIKNGKEVIKLNQFKDYLFQFISDGEEYSINELLEE